MLVIQKPRVLVNLRDLAFRFIPALADPEASTEAIRRRIFIIVCASIGIPAMLFWTGQEPQGSDFSVVLAIGVFVLSGTLIATVRAVYEGIAIHAAFLYVCFIFFFMIHMDRGPEDMLWLNLIPILSIFLFGIYAGSLWTAGFFTLSLLFGVGFFPGFERSESLMEANLDYLFTYFLIFAFSFCFEALRLQAQTRTSNALTEVRRQNERIITAQKERDQIENRLVQYNKLASDWLWETDAELRFTYLSRRFEQVAKVPASNVIGLSILEMLDAYDDCDREAHKERLRNHESFRDFRYSVQIHGQSRIYLSTRGEAQFDESGNFVGYIGSGTDMTEYEQSQIALRQQDRRLQHIQRLDAIGQLTSGIAHDFNNLLMVIRGNSEMLMAGVKDTDNELLEAVNTAAKQGSELTAKLLSFSRDQPLQRSTVNVQELFDGVSQLLKHSIGDGIELQLDVTASINELEIDRGQLESALVNLVINGRDAMEGKGTITLGAVPRSTNSGGGVEFFVRDEGPGIPEEILDRVFEPFFTTKPLGKGTGLGLSMVFGFASQCGGDLKIENLPDGGALVRLWLPEVSPDLTHHDHPTPVQPATLDTLKVLLVEDDPKVRDIMVRMLGLLRQDTETCETAEAALELLKDRDYQLVISDVMLGAGMDGITLSDHIQQSYPATHVLLTSGYPERVIADGIELNCPLLKKPFGFRELTTELTQLMGV